MRVYIASPMFSSGELAFNAELATALEVRHTVFLPQRDGLRMSELIATHSADAASVLVFAEDRGAIEACDVVVAVLDGASVDPGVAWEMGYAFALGKPIIGLNTDLRSFASFGMNPMISQPLVCCCRSTTEVLHLLDGLVPTLKRG